MRPKNHQIYIIVYFKTQNSQKCVHFHGVWDVKSALKLINVEVYQKFTYKIGVGLTVFPSQSQDVLV